MVLLREKVPNTNYVLFLASFFKQTFFIHLAYIIAMKLDVIIQVIGEKVMYKKVNIININQFAQKLNTKCHFTTLQYDTLLKSQTCHLLRLCME